MVVPFMALGYIIVACVIIAINIDDSVIWKRSALFGASARDYVGR